MWKSQQFQKVSIQGFGISALVRLDSLLLWIPVRFVR